MTEPDNDSQSYVTARYGAQGTPTGARPCIQQSRADSGISRSLLVSCKYIDQAGPVENPQLVETNCGLWWSLTWNLSGGGGPGGQNPPFFCQTHCPIMLISSTVLLCGRSAMLHAGEAYSPPACSLKAVWSLYLPGPPFQNSWICPCVMITAGVRNRKS